MSRFTAFVAYPADPSPLAASMRRAIERIETAWGKESVTGWEENDVSGRPLTDPIFSTIPERQVLIADITYLNFNVSYEIGFSIGQNKKIILLRNISLEGDSNKYPQIGIFDTLGYYKYNNSDELYAYWTEGIRDLSPLRTDFNLNKAAPLYYLAPENKSDSLVHLRARIEATKIRTREFDPYQQPRLSASEAIEQVASSAAVIVPLLAARQTNFQVHNIRAAFVAGLARGLGVSCLVLQSVGGPVPLDLRDLVETYMRDDQIDGYVAQMLPGVMEALYQPDRVATGEQGILHRLDFGQYIAEHETATLGRYYVATDEFRTVVDGRARLVVGRKGSGKTAAFMQARDRWRPNKDYLVVDLRPEDFRLLKLRDAVLRYLAPGTRVQLLTAFWEYLLLLEISSTILEEDYLLHLRNHHLTQPYQLLAEHYKEGQYFSGADFSERMVQLIDRLAQRYEVKFGYTPEQQLKTAQVLSLLYEHDLPVVRKILSDYLKFKDTVFVLFDNLDKGWSSDGLRPQDVDIVKGLVAAADRLEKYLERESVDCHVTIFLRNDIYEFLVDATPDRGKTTRVSLDWRDTDLLKRLVLNRLVANKLHEVKEFNFLWNLICAPHISGEASFEYVVDRCLMRPRYLLKILRYSKTVAINRLHLRIEESDLLRGIEDFSNELVMETAQEIRDVIPEAGEVIYSFLGEKYIMSREAIISLFPGACQEPSMAVRLFDLLLWFGVMGLYQNQDHTVYIYDSLAGYSLTKLKALAGKTASALFRINPAFEPGLALTRG